MSNYLDGNGRLVEERTSNDRPYVAVDKKTNSRRATLYHPNGSPIKITQNFVGYSDKPKPAGMNGDSYVELDTKKVFLHDGTDWREF